MSFNDIENVSLKIPAVLKQNLKSVFLQQTFFCSVRARLLTKKYKKNQEQITKYLSGHGATLCGHGLGCTQEGGAEESGTGQV